MVVSSFPLSLLLSFFSLTSSGKSSPKATLSTRETMVPVFRLVHLDFIPVAHFQLHELQPGLEFHSKGQESCYFSFLPRAHHRNFFRPSSPSYLCIDWKHSRERERERTCLITKLCLCWNPNKFSVKTSSMWFPWQEAKFTWRAHGLNDGDDFLFCTS